MAIINHDKNNVYFYGYTFSICNTYDLKTNLIPLSEEDKQKASDLLNASDHDSIQTPVFSAVKTYHFALSLTTEEYESVQSIWKL